ncbi:MAG: hypothetical protein DRI24_17050 [Deltaproteobacteria bacterium]|nr:MAG: hypothetical protein DRI24_17050 [Deltaproteobacteria bacterium]
MNVGIEIANRLEAWMLEEGDISLSDVKDISDEAACLMHYFPEVDSTEAEALSFLLYYAPVENRMSPTDAIPLVFDSPEFSSHLIKCCEEQTYWDGYVGRLDTYNDTIRVEETYFEEDVDLHSFVL